jgi:hypothetical protein
MMLATFNGYSRDDRARKPGGVRLAQLEASHDDPKERDQER